MAKKKIATTSEKRKPQKDYHKPKRIKLVDGTEVEERYHNDYGAKPVFSPEKEDEEASGTKPKDKASKHKYPPPRKNAIFRAKWMQFIDNVISRDSFKEAHLEVLCVLCDLYVEYEDLSTTLRREGRFYKSVTRFGELKKIHPAVQQLEKARASIAKYTRQLDLFPRKDSGREADGEESDWS